MDPRERFRTRLASGPLLADGGMGTLLFSRGVPQRANLDELVADAAGAIGAIHREYLAAGADLIETATFGANRLRLASYGLADQASPLNRRAAQLAREARDVSGRDAWVAGSIGPLGAPTRELVASAGDARSARRSASRSTACSRAGSTCSCSRRSRSSTTCCSPIDEARSAASLPVVAQLTFGEDLELPDGTTPGDRRRGAHRGRRRRHRGQLRRRPGGLCRGARGDGRRRTAPNSSILPNAGLPQRIEGQFVYAASPEYLGAMVAALPRRRRRDRRRLLRDDARAHRGDARGARRARPGSADDGRRPRDGRARHAPRLVRPRPTADARPTAAPPPTRLARALAERPLRRSRSRSTRRARSGSTGRSRRPRLLQAAGVDCVNISDSAMARVRMGALAVAFGIQHDLDLECIVHTTTRDRNLMALESELLGAHALGVRNILALTGDPPRIGDYPTGTGVWDVDSIGLIEILARLNRGEDAAGSPIGQPAGFTIACALDPTAADTADRMGPPRTQARGRRPPDHDPAAVRPRPGRGDVRGGASAGSGRAGSRSRSCSGSCRCRARVTPSSCTTRCPASRSRTRPGPPSATAGERGADVGLAMTLELLEAVGSRVAGTYIMPSFGRYEQAAELVRRLRTGAAVS